MFPVRYELHLYILCGAETFNLRNINIPLTKTIQLKGLTYLYPPITVTALSKA
jgi:hypothetical protein